MTNYLASRPDFAELAKLETSTATLRRNALTAYDAHRAELARLDDPRDREHRDLDGSERVAARLKLREETLARLGKLGDLDAQRAAITSAAKTNNFFIYMGFLIVISYDLTSQFFFN